MASASWQRPHRKQVQNLQFSGYRLPTAQSLPVSPTGRSAFPIGSSKQDYTISAVTQRFLRRAVGCAAMRSKLLQRSEPGSFATVEVSQSHCLRVWHGYAITVQLF